MNEDIRRQFPALQRLHHGKPLVFLDGPAGTQVPESVIEAISQYYRTSNANSHGQFVTTHETDALLEDTRVHLAALLNAAGGHTISFGQNMTSLTFSLSRAISRLLRPGDEVLITQLDHEANRAPWLSLREQGIIVREVRLLPEGILDYEDLEQKINERTRLLCMGYASNILGTVNDVHLARQLTHRVGAWLLLDAVHYTPHLPLDVQAIGCDFLLCSAYKFYGPHVGVLYTRPGLLDRLPTDRLRTAWQHAPYSIETGTLNHAAIAGVRAAVQFIANLGEGDTLREQLMQAMLRISRYERQLVQQLYDGLLDILGVSIHGISMDKTVRAPTLAVTLAGRRPDDVCRFLAAHNICAWDGHFYAIRTTEVLGLLEQGGVTRLGISLYTTAEEVEYTLEIIRELMGYN
ncbi:MAG TPA: cysteine desulfurase-like protein [Saprospiraceae bacterium]|mgnify:FL=1|nr:cysteine desulfurase-like protein [Saprospiraceae bacterium]HMP23860.1 cysteine desulfurase-like protein [Saprospiraceae bacterium]